MKAFRFPLESLRVLRQQRESISQQAYARALVLCEGAARVQQMAEDELAASQDILVAELSRGATAGRIINLRTWCAVLEVRRNECQVALAAARREAGEAFLQMTTAARDREALDRFHEKSQRAWQREAQRIEQRTYDEMSVQRQAALGMAAPQLN
jgi:flagellar export protein FliJ